MPDITIQRERQSHFWRNALIVIIIAMLLWEYAVPFIDDSIKTPSDYIQEALEPDLSDVYWQLYIIDQVTGHETLYDLTGVQQGAIFQMEEYKSYEIGIETNAPGSLFGTWRLNLRIEILATGNVTPISIQIPAYTFYASHRVEVSQDLYYANYERSDSLTINFIDPDGEYVGHASNDAKSFLLGMDSYP